MKTRISNIIISTTTISRNGNGIFCFGRNMDSGEGLKDIVDF